MSEEITWTKEYKLERYHKLNLTAEKGCVLFAGSSLMEMFPVEKFAHEDGLPVTVYNRGVGGFITDELIAAVDTCIIDLAPKKLFINIGTNDLSDASRSMEQIMSNYALILDKVKKAVPEVRMYLMAYYPVNYSAATPEMKPCLLIRSNEKIARANEEVKDARRPLRGKLHRRHRPAEGRKRRFARRIHDRRHEHQRGRLPFHLPAYQKVHS